MSRRSKAQRTLTEPDPIYNSRLVTLLVSRILKSGKKSLAQRIVYNALQIISKRIALRRSLSKWSAMYSHLHSGITIEIWRRGAKSVQACWPARFDDSFDDSAHS